MVIHAHYAQNTKTAAQVSKNKCAATHPRSLEGTLNISRKLNDFKILFKSKSIFYSELFSHPNFKKKFKLEYCDQISTPFWNFQKHFHT